VYNNVTKLFGLLLKKAKPDIDVLVLEYVGLVFLL